MEIERLSVKYGVLPLVEADVAAVYSLSLGNPLFYQYCPPPVTEAGIRADMTALPPGKAPEDKHYLGFFDGRNLVAVMDLIEKYPDDDTVYIGLFMMDSHYQGRGVGTAIISEAANCLKQWGYRQIKLAFAKGNPQSEAFWLKNHFRKTGQESDMGDYVAVRMCRAL